MTASTMIAVMTTIANSGTTGMGTQTMVCGGLLQASECISAAQQDMMTSLFFFIFNQNVETLVSDVCLKYENHRQCVKGALVSCTGSARVSFDVVIAAFDFICSPVGRATVNEAWPCISDHSVGQHLRSCSQQIFTANTTEGYSPCFIASDYVGCVSGTFQQRCSAQSADAIQEILTATLAPYYSVFNCPVLVITAPPSSSSSSSPSPLAPTTSTSNTTTTAEIVTTSLQPSTTTTTSTTTTPSTPESTTIPTTTPMMTTPEAETTTTTTTSTTTTAPTTTTTTTARPAFIGCYDCSTGIRGYWANPACRVDGFIGSTVSKTPCSSSCFMRVSRGGVYRGCSSGYAYTFNNNIPKSGCTPVQDGSHTDMWCFCDSEGCNTLDMTQHILGPSGHGNNPTV